MGMGIHVNKLAIIRKYFVLMEPISVDCKTNLDSIDRKGLGDSIQSYRLILRASLWLDTRFSLKYWLFWSR